VTQRIRGSSPSEEHGQCAIEPLHFRRRHVPHGLADAIRRTVVTLSTAIQDARSNGSADDGCTDRRIIGASPGTVVSGQTVTLSSVPNASDCTITANRGLPV